MWQETRTAFGFIASSAGMKNYCRWYGILTNILPLDKLIFSFTHEPRCSANSKAHSIDGIGLPTAVAILVRLPEVGQITREQAVALAGLAPYDDDSGQHFGVRHIAGGRKRLRRAVYTASLAASFRWNLQLIELYQRLIAAGKGHKRALVACARKMIIFANTVVARGTPWGDKPPPLKAALAPAS